MQKAYIMNDLQAYLEMVKLAQERGKKPGDSMQKEFDEILEKHPEYFTLLGNVDKDVDQLTGDLREKFPNKKIFNLHEYERQKQQEE